ncbi:MAG: hypothetical protein K2Z81_07210, partial [Cyanobacteria bacterium]|nr:hypothetical protein [Cyanobacteriota bacterium]
MADFPLDAPPPPIESSIQTGSTFSPSDSSGPGPADTVVSEPSEDVTGLNFVDLMRDPGGTFDASPNSDFSNSILAPFGDISFFDSRLDQSQGQEGPSETSNNDTVSTGSSSEPDTIRGASGDVEQSGSGSSDDSLSAEIRTTALTETHEGEPTTGPATDIEAGQVEQPTTTSSSNDESINLGNFGDESS